MDIHIYGDKIGIKLQIELVDLSFLGILAIRFRSTPCYAFCYVVVEYFSIHLESMSYSVAER